MANPKKLDQKASSSVSFASYIGECESMWLLRGPPFDPRDYMISPSESESTLESEKNVDTSKKKKLRPSDIKIDSKYIIDSRKALKKILDLIKDGCAEELLDRLEDLIQIFLQGSPMGFLVDDLSLIIEIVEYFSRNQSSVPKFTEFVKRIMCFAREPPKVMKVSDTLRFKEAIADYFTLFGELLATFEDECFQLNLLETLDCFIIRRKLVDVCCVKLSFCHDAMETSHLPCIVAALMETVPISLYIYYVELALQMIWVSVKAGCAMAQSNIIQFVLQRMNLPISEEPEEIFEESPEKKDELYQYYRLIDKSSYLIWGLFAIISKYNIQIPVPNKQALWSLKLAFKRERKKKSQRAIDTRNNLAGIIAKLCAVFGEQLALAETGLIADAAALSVATEIKLDRASMKDLQLGFSKEDYILKKLMLLCCCLFAKSETFIPIFKHHRVIDGVLRLINPKTTVSWIPSQFLNLLIIGLRTLSELAPKFSETYLQNKGNARLISTIKWLMKEHFDQDSLFQALKTFCTIITCGNECIINDAKAKGGVKVMLDMCFRLLDMTFMKLEHQEKLSRIFVTLERLLKNDEKAQIKYEESCVSISVKLLQRILADSPNDSKWNPNLFVSFGGFLWEAVAWCSLSVKSFIEKGGIFLLLDFIESSPFPVQMLFLGVLVDMTDEGETIAHLLTWRGENGYGILSMIIDIWRKEEYLNKVQRTKDGVILDVEAPLMTQEQWYLTHQVIGGHIYSPSIAEMMCSSRPKIHALYQFLQRRYFSLTEIGESTYCLQMKMIKPSYQVYIPLIENYLALKMGEIWSEVIRDANISGIFPTAFDGEVICTLLDEKNKWASRIKTVQEEILLMQRGGDASEEKQLYNFLASCRLSSALKVLRELDYIARTSFQKFQTEKKNQQNKDLMKGSASYSFSENKNIHSTFLSNTNVTFLNFDKICVNSEKITDPSEHLIPVSPESSSDNRFDWVDEID